MQGLKRYCPLCAGAGGRVLFTKAGIPLIRCNNCGFIFLGVDRSLTALMEIYSEKLFASEGLEKYYLADDETTRANSAAHVRFVERYKSSGRLLDVGCGFGYFLKALGPRWASQGVEISEFASGQARSRFGVEVVSADFPKADLPPGSFDAITMWDYIEHIPRPIDNLKKAHALLKPDGLLFLSTPDAGSFIARLMGRLWYHYDPLQHLCYFSSATLRMALSMCGFKMLALRHAGRCFNIEYLAYRFKYTYPGLWGNATYAILRPLLRLLHIKSRHVRLNMGDIMTVCAARAMS